MLPIIPAGTIGGLDMVGQIIGKVHGAQWIKPFVDFLGQRAEIVWGGPPKPDQLPTVFNEA